MSNMLEFLGGYSNTWGVPKLRTLVRDLPLASLIGTVNPHTCTDNTVGVEHLHHLDKLFLDIALELLVSNWQSGK